MKRPSRSSRLRHPVVVVGGVLLLAFAARLLYERWTVFGPPSTAESRDLVGVDGSGAETIARAYQSRLSGIFVESQGTVERLLRDDEQGARHQRFILRLESGQTLLVSHNIDLAPRVPLAPGDHVRFRGQYEWNEQGGVVHWTHHDPDGRRPGGWIRHGDEVFR